MGHFSSGNVGYTSSIYNCAFVSQRHTSSVLLAPANKGALLLPFGSRYSRFCGDNGPTELLLVLRLCSSNVPRPHDVLVDLLAVHLLAAIPILPLTAVLVAAGRDSGPLGPYLMSQSGSPYL